MLRYFQFGLLTFSIPLSFLAWLLPVTSHIDENGKYFGIDCEAGSAEHMLWVAAGVFIFFGLVMNVRNFRKPLFIVAMLCFALSIGLKQSQISQHNHETNSDIECAY